MNFGIENILFLLVFAFGIFWFSKNVKKLIRNIRLGYSVKIPKSERKQRLKVMTRVALGQSKMGQRPIAGFLHLIIYVGFILINLELIEIIIDGIFGTHRVFSFMGDFYVFLINFFEFLAVGVIIGAIVFWIRRNILNISRFRKSEMKGWPKNDGNIILYIEVILMVLFLSMNTADVALQEKGEYEMVESFLFSGYFAQFIDSWNVSGLIVLERFSWWGHIIGILFFLNYIYYSKHLHIILAFPYTYLSNLKPLGQFKNIEAVTKEVKMMMDPDADPYTTTEVSDSTEEVHFGAKDVNELSEIQLLSAYTCTECGRCTDECPANQTGKKLSPRKIMMDTRDRLEEVGRKLDKKEDFQNHEKKLLKGYISEEELWACTTCNACTQACPINLDPLSIIMDLRQSLVMEESNAPNELNVMMGNIENNGAPWPFAPTERENWTKI